MVTFPQTYTVSATAANGVASPWETSGPAGVTLIGAIPPEFDGPGGGFSPEELYALALANCFVATFKVVAERSRMAFKQLDVRAALTVDLSPEGKPWMAAMNFHVALSGVENIEKAHRLLEKSTTSCLILNSVKTEKHFEFTVTG